MKEDDNTKLGIIHVAVDAQNIVMYRKKSEISLFYKNKLYCTISLFIVMFSPAYVLRILTQFLLLYRFWHRKIVTLR